MRKNILFVLLIPGFLACQDRPAADSKTKEATILAVKQVLDNYCNDVRDEGLMAELKYLDHSADFFWNPPGYKNTISYDSVVAVLKQNAPFYKSIDSRFENLKVIYLDEEFASYTGKLNLEMIDTTGKISKATLLETGLMVKRKDGWKIMGGQTSAL